MTAESELLAWYATHGRDLPWRQTRDPYRILLSETMLQQTQVERVIDYYQRFLAHFPDARALADSDLESAHRLWQGLGYPSRVERLRATCQQVVYERHGIWPDSVEGLRQLPGIGPYTAAAVATFALGLNTPVVDTNIARVYTRRDGLDLPQNAAQRRQLWQHAAIANDGEQPIAYNNALMDLGAMVCTARNPRCEACPWAARCASRGHREQLIASANPLKVASQRKVYSAAPRNRRLPRIPIVLALVHHQGRYLVARRPQGRRHGGHWELPGGKCEPGEADRQALARELAEETGLELLAARPFVTVYDQQAEACWVLKVYRCRVYRPEQAQALASDGLAWVTPEAFLELPFPPANAPIGERLRDYHRLPR